MKTRNMLEIKTPKELYKYVINHNLRTVAIIMIMNNSIGYNCMPVEGKLLRWKDELWFSFDKNAILPDLQKDMRLEQTSEEILQDENSIFIASKIGNGDYNLIIGNTKGREREEVEFFLMFTDFVKCADIATVNELNEAIENTNW